MDNNLIEHVTPEELADYYAARIAEAREEEIEAHLARCDACVEEARQCYAFAAIREEWTGAATDDVAEQGVIQDALVQAQRQEGNPTWRARLARWQTHWQGKAAAAARLVMEAADQAVHG
jgi:anti-sigma factor RsiW